jgi:hypothetical protein
VIFEFFTYPSPKKVSLKLLKTVGYTSRNGEEKQEISREVGEWTNTTFAN